MYIYCIIEPSPPNNYPGQVTLTFLMTLKILLLLVIRARPFLYFASPKAVVSLTGLLKIYVYINTTHIIYGAIYALLSPYLTSFFFYQISNKCLKAITLFYVNVSMQICNIPRQFILNVFVHFDLLDA